MSFLHGLRILIVEDHEVQRRLVARFLMQHGAQQVRCAADGSSALEILGDPRVELDLVICDLAMPGMDGIQLARRIGSGVSSPSWILLSAVSPELVQALTNSLGAAAFLLGSVAKPLTAETLAPLVELHRKRTAPAAGGGSD